MIGFATPVRSLRALIVLVTVIVLSGAVWVVGTHDHAPSGAHACAVCTIAHAPSVVDVVALSVAAPRPAGTPVTEHIVPAPMPVAFGIASSRAPPQS